MTASTAQGGAGVRPGTATSDPLRAVMFVGGDGSATVVYAATCRSITTIDTVPERAERMAEILGSSDQLAFYPAVQQPSRTRATARATARGSSAQVALMISPG